MLQSQSGTSAKTLQRMNALFLPLPDLISLTPAPRERSWGWRHPEHL